MTGKRRSQITIDSDSSSQESNGLDSDQFDDSSNYQLRTDGSNIKSELKSRKRGRGPSKRPCQNRNAMMARMNRQKKKEHLEKIEKKLSTYYEENKNLKNVIQKQTIDIKRLKAEVSYLRSVLNNNTTITALMKAINGILRSNKSREINNKENKLNDNKAIITGIDLNEVIMALEPESSDHTYSYPGYSHQLFNFEGVNCDSSTGFMTFESSTITPDLDVDIKPPSLTIDNVDLGVTDQDIEQLAMDNNIFDNITDNEAMTEPIDFIRSSNNAIDDGNIFDNLDNSGVCVHVNSGRVSLEFCSVCHLNSINSDDP